MSPCFLFFGFFYLNEDMLLNTGCLSGPEAFGRGVKVGNEWFTFVLKPWPSCSLAADEGPYPNIPLVNALPTSENSIHTI